MDRDGAWRIATGFFAVAAVFAAGALVRPVDHDESQYVAAAVLTAHGLIPYRDFAYFQTPLQPLLFAPVALAGGRYAWLVLRMASAVCAAATVGFVWCAARGDGATRGNALCAALLLAGCDIVLFSAATARNDALPALLASAALPLIVRAAKGRATPAAAVLAGLLLASAAAAKLSYAIPAAAYGGYALLHIRHRPAFVALGTLPVLALMLILYRAAPAAMIFDVFGFPVRAPAQYYASAPWKLTIAAKAADAAKFLALGAALPALLAAGRGAWQARRTDAIEVLAVAGLIAALLPQPTWRQYLMPLLPPLFVLFARAATARPLPSWSRAALIPFILAGLAPTALSAVPGGEPPNILSAMKQGRALAAAMDRAGVAGPVATLAPQFLPMTGRLPDPRFAPGPFYFRSRNLLAAETERDTKLISRDRLSALPGDDAIMTGAEGGSSGDARLDDVLANFALRSGWRRIDVPETGLTLFVRQPA